MTMDFLDISYLAGGGERQRHCFDVLTRIGIMETLKPYNPVLAGSIPIGIDIPLSDLDIICQVSDMKAFADFMQENFHRYEDFNIRSLDEGAIVCGFFEDGEEIEVYGSPVPPVRTNGYRHMLTEFRLLNILGPAFKEEIVSLKQQGMRTEPAFAWLLGLQGDPYTAVRNLETYSDEQLSELFAF